MQGAQTESRFRGIGRYSLSLALAIARNSNEHEIWLALNAAFPQSILDIRHVFAGLIPQERIRVFDVPLPVFEYDSENSRRTRVAEWIREYFLQQFEPDIILLTSLFEGFIDDAVTSVNVCTSGHNTAIIHHDLIPYLNPKKYLPTRTHRNYYARKIECLKKAGLVLSNSEATKNEAITVLGLLEDTVVNISAAVDDKFRLINYTPDQIQQLFRKYGIERRMVMYAPGGFDSRKNFENLIQAYSLLPKKLRSEHQLAIVSKVEESQRQNLMGVAQKAGLVGNELVLTGYVPDEDLIALYNLASLFVFPSKHEGFGLPLLEAMACGAPVIGSNVTSIPEVIGLQEALFDPYSAKNIAQKMEQALVDKTWAAKLVSHGLKQAVNFSWDSSAKLALAAFESFHAKMADKHCVAEIGTIPRPKLAFFSPLPPMRSGISNYSVELLPELAAYYDIDVIASQPSISDSLINANCTIKTIDWFQQNALMYDRILYQFGNSPFHSHMFKLLRQHPGVVMLHDFFLSGVLAHDEVTGEIPNAWADALYLSHGYQSVQKRFCESDIDKIKDKYPANLEVLQNALGVLVHSDYSKYLARQWYGKASSDGWAVIPHLRKPVLKPENKMNCRRALKLEENDFVICSFGFLAPTKLNHRLLDAWLSSSLSKKTHCKLIYVGENHGGNYGANLLKTINESGLEERIRITGWVDTVVFSQYLAAADLGVQLRTLSRGETSGAVIDCMNYSLPTIVNANGSMSDLPKDAVWMLPDEFTHAELIDALETLWENNERRNQLAKHAREVIITLHDPKNCAKQYAQAIEGIYRAKAIDPHALVKAIGSLDNFPSDNKALAHVAKSIAASFVPKINQNQLFIDTSSITRHDLKSGIERVVRAQLMELIKNSPSGFRIEPVYLTDQGGQWHYRYAKTYTYSIFGLDAVNVVDTPIDISQGDVFYGLDFCPNDVIEAAMAGIYLHWKAIGVSINFLVYDLLPILRPEFFPNGVDVIHAQWLKTIAEFSSQLICISNAVAEELRIWLKSNLPARNEQLKISAVHLGADITASVPSKGLPDDAGKLLSIIGSSPAFILVGTIEPRKGYLQTIAAFELLWEQGIQVNLVIVGNEGWTPLSDGQRRTIPVIVEKLRSHQELNSRLFWLEGISDEYLEKIYDASVCLIAASEGEGFGLPLIEAARHKLPIIARKIPVFYEVAGEHAFYFTGIEKEALADAIKNWLMLSTTNNFPRSEGMPCLTWRQNSQQVLASLVS